MICNLLLYIIFWCFRRPDLADRCSFKLASISLGQALINFSPSVLEYFFTSWYNETFWVYLVPILSQPWNQVFLEESSCFQGEWYQTTVWALGLLTATAVSSFWPFQHIKLRNTHTQMFISESHECTAVPCIPVGGRSTFLSPIPCLHVPASILRTVTPSSIDKSTHLFSPEIHFINSLRTVSPGLLWQARPIKEVWGLLQSSSPCPGLRHLRQMLCP